MTRWRRTLREAFTLVEGLLAATILAVAITAITMPFTASAQNQVVDSQRTIAVTLAQEMMEEILSKPFQDPDQYTAPGPDSGETSRALFDNIDDYNGYVEPPGEIMSVSGQRVLETAAANLSRNVSAVYVHVDGQTETDPYTFIRVKVEVRSAESPVVTLTRLVYASAH